MSHYLSQLLPVYFLVKFIAATFDILLNCKFIPLTHKPEVPKSDSEAKQANKIHQLVTNSNVITLRLGTNCLGFMETSPP